MKSLIKGIDKTIEVISATITVGILVLVTLQIIMRYVFNSPLIWSEELARFGLVLMTFFGSSLAMSQNEHIYVSIIVDRLKGKVLLAVLIVARIITCAFMGYLIYFGITFALMNLKQMSPANEISMGIIYLSIPLNALIWLIYNSVLKISNSSEDVQIN